MVGAVPLTYAGTLEDECRHAWKTEQQTLQMDKDMGLLPPGNGTGKRNHEEVDPEEPPSKKTRVTVPYTSQIVPVKEKRNTPGITQPALTRKYLVFCDDNDGIAVSRSRSQATFKHLECAIGLCSSGDLATKRTCLTYRKGDWVLTNAGNRLAFYRVPGKSAILMESNIRCPPLRELTDCLSVFLPGRFDDVTEYARYDNEYTRERAAFSVNIKKHTLFKPVQDWKGLQNVSLYAQGGIGGGYCVQYGFPFAKIRCKLDEMFAGKRYRLEGTELMGAVTMCHFSMMFTFLLNTVAHNERAAGQPAFRALMRELLLASHPDCWVSQTKECSELLAFLTKFQQRVNSWIGVFSAAP